MGLKQIQGGKSRGSQVGALATVMAQSREGDPYRYGKDGTVLGNHERLLSSQTRGDYRGCTVPTQA